MTSIVLGILAAVCAAGWFFNHVAVSALACYMKEKGYTPPTDAELRACTRRAILKTLHLEK